MISFSKERKDTLTELEAHLITGNEFRIEVLREFDEKITAHERDSPQIGNIEDLKRWGMRALALFNQISSQISTKPIHQPDRPARDFEKCLERFGKFYGDLQPNVVQCARLEDSRNALIIALMARWRQLAGDLCAGDPIVVQIEVVD